MNKNTKAIMKDMEFLMKELHKEWDRTGATKKVVEISFDDVEIVNGTILDRIAGQQKAVENENMTFRKCIKLSKENYVLLRLAGKIREEEHRVYHSGKACVLSVCLDKDEYRFYKQLMKNKKI